MLLTVTQRFIGTNAAPSPDQGSPGGDMNRQPDARLVTEIFIAIVVTFGPIVLVA